MAIDTAAKRRSAGGVAFLPLGPGVTPDALKPLAWRQQAGWGYSGISVALVVVDHSAVPRMGGDNPRTRITGGDNPRTRLTGSVSPGMR